MITMSGSFKVKHKENVEKYCLENDLIIDYLSNLGNCYYYNIGGETIKIDKLMKFVEQLNKK